MESEVRHVQHWIPSGVVLQSYWGIGVRGRSLLRLPRLKRLRTVRTLFIV